MKLIFISFLLFISFSSIAQQTSLQKQHQKEINASAVVYLMDTLFQYGKPICILKRFPTSNKNADFFVRDFNSKDLINIKFETNVGNFGSYQVKFLQSGRIVKFKGLEKEVPDLIANNELISNNSVNGIAEERFVKSNGGNMYPEDPSYPMPVRNRNVGVLIAGEGINQDLIKIGTVKENQGFYENKIFYESYTFLLNNGVKVCDVAYAENGNEAKIIFAKTGKVTTINVTPSNGIKKQIAEYLTSNYLM